MLRRCLLTAAPLLPFALALLACRRESPTPSPEPSAAPSAVASRLPSSPALASATTSASAARPPAPPRDAPLSDEEKKRIAAHKAAMARGRKTTKAKEYDKAITAFTEAATADPTDARALSERGFAKLLSDDVNGANDDLSAAMALTADPELLSPIWFNLGLAREKGGKDEEGARVAFANAHLLKPSAATRAKVAGKSTCTVELRKTDLDDLKSATGWRGIHDIVGPAESANGPPPQSEPEAQEQVCAPDHLGMFDSCSEDAVFTLMRAYMMYTWNQHWVFPRGKGLYWVYEGSWRIGGWPRRCSGNTSTVGSVEGGIIQVRTQNDGKEAAFDGEVNDEGRCKDGVAWTNEEYFDAATGKGLVSAHWLGTSGATIRVEGRTVVVEGAGCNERIALGK